MRLPVRVTPKGGRDGADGWALDAEGRPYLKVRVSAVAAEGAAKGYADTVRILYGYSPACQCITGFGLVASKETPGIGDKIVTDREFLANFAALDVKLNAELSALANEVKAVKHGSKTNPWQVDAIAESANLFRNAFESGLSVGSAFGGTMSSIRTGMPALARCAAIPLPITPAPRTATLRIFMNAPERKKDAKRSDP